MSTEPAHRSITWRDNDSSHSPAVNYHWIENHSVPLCQFPSNLPKDRKIGWRLDLGSFRDAAGFEGFSTLAITTTGQRIVPTPAITRSGGNANLTGTGIKPFTSCALDLSDDLDRLVPFERIRTPEENFTYQFTDTAAQYLKARFSRLREINDSISVQRPHSTQGTVWTNSTRTSPLANATVGTSLDGVTIKTDSYDRFFLLADTPASNQSCSVIITSGTQSRAYGPMGWGDQPRNQVFKFN